MDPLVLDIGVRILTTLSVALLVWGGWLCIGGAALARISSVAESTKAPSA